ncbi:MAG TPA: ABC transporter permease subunit [Thermoleophilaceae bacterium]|nr:ABC transporter permease subunit [Thermoleophilaceae bacterium]
MIAALAVVAPPDVGSFGYIAGQLLDGLVTALKLTGATLLIALPLALLLAILSDSRLAVARWPALVVVELGRGLPLLILLYLMYQGLPQLAVTLSSFTTALIAFSWATAAYATEIVRGSLGAIPRGQFEAARAVGLSSGDVYRFAILPQAGRVALPPLLNLAIQIFQLTSITFVIGLPEIMQHAYLGTTVNFLYMKTFLMAGALYAAIALPGSALVGILDKRLSRHVQTV